MRTRVAAQILTPAAVVGPLLVAGAAAMGMLLVLSPHLVLLVLLGGLAVVAPRWSLLAAAVVLSRGLTGVTVVDQLQYGDLALIAFVARGSVRVLFTSDRRLTRPGPGSAWLGLLLAWTWITTVWNDALSSATAVGRLSLYAAAFGLASTDRRLAFPLLRFLAAYATLEALLAIAGVTEHDGARNFGVYGDPSQTGLLMIAGLFATQAVVRVSTIRWTATALLASGVVMSFTRSMWIAGAIATLVWVWPSIQRRLARLILVVTGGVGVAWMLVPYVTSRFSLSVQSIDVRIRSWDTGIELLLQEPVTGNGWGLRELGFPVDAPAPFNLWIYVAASTGLLGAILVSIFAFTVLQELGRSTEALQRGWLPYVVAFFVVSLGEMTVWPTGPATIEFFCITGAVTAVGRGSLLRVGPAPQVAAGSELFAAESNGLDA